MIKFKARFESIELSATKYNEAFMEMFLDRVKVAANRFMEAAIAAIPSYPATSEWATNFTAGAFGNIAEAIGKSLNLQANPNTYVVTLSSKTGRPIRARINQYYYSDGGRILKTPVSGRQLATPPSEIITKRGRNGYTFKFGVNISYYLLQEVSEGVSPTAPWQALVAGTKAFLDYMRRTKVFPDIRK